ncbi:MAG: hypothetical protein WBG35_09525 [Acidobacteriaceae bacterium]
MVTVVERLPAYVSYVSAVAPDVPQILQQESKLFTHNCITRPDKRLSKWG